MVQPDPALGISATFDNDGFRNAIRFAMQMGANPDVSRQPRFVKRSSARTYWKNNTQLTTVPRMDLDGNPLDPDIEVRSPDAELVAVDCAVEIVRAEADEVPVGNFRPVKAVVTLLDEQYQLVKGVRELLYNGDQYIFGYEPESNGLFEVGVYTMIFYAKDES